MNRSDPPPPPPVAAEPLFTIAEVAELWRVSQEHVRREIRRGRLHAIRAGARAWRIPASSLVEYVRDAEGSPEPIA